MEPTDNNNRPDIPPSSTQAENVPQDMKVPQPAPVDPTAVKPSRNPLLNFGKKGLLPVIIVFVLLGGGAAAYFGAIVPNRPENVWKRSLNNTAKGYDLLVAYGNQQKDTKGARLKGSFKLDSAQAVADGSIEGKFDQKNTNLTIDAGAAGNRLKFNLLTNVPEGASLPDLYIKAEGLDGIASLLAPGDPSAAQMLSSLNNQYYFIDHTLFEQIQKEAAQRAPAPTDIKPEDVQAFLKKLGEVNREYVFTTDEDKAIFRLKESKGKETVEGRPTYRYKVGLDKDNLKQWNQAVCDKVLDDRFYKSLSEGISDKQRKEECEDTSDFDNVNESKTADVWVDAKTKLIRTVRITENDDEYYDFGMQYEKGDDYPFYFKAKTKEGEVNIRLTLNTRSNKVSVDLDAGFDDGGEESKFTLDMTVEPSDEAVDFKKPEGAKSMGDLLAPFMGGSSGLGGLGVTSPAGGTDSQRCLQAFEEWANSNGTSDIPYGCAGTGI